MMYVLLLYLICALLLTTPVKWGHAISKTLPWVLGLGFLYFLAPLMGSESFETQSFSIPWIPSLGITLSFKMDALALFFSLLITGIGTAVFLYADGYVQKRKKAFGITLLFFTASMLGLVQANHFIVFFVFWELTSISSFMLIAHNNENAQAKDNARTALFVTVGGGFCMLVGLVMLSLVGQNKGMGLEESLLFSSFGPLQTSDHPLILISFALIMLGIATKSAQFPFHFWLPLAMSGPAPVSSFLHSATMVKAGVFLSLRMFPIFSSDPLWSKVLVTMGGVTMFIGAFLCVSQKDIKRILAYSTISALGVMIMLIGHGSEKAMQTALVFLLAHALYKASLFQIAGNIERSSNQKNLFHLSSLKSILPITCLSAILAVLSFVGIPPWIGFYAKEMTYLLGLTHASWGGWILSLSFLSFVMMGVMAICVAAIPFWKHSSISGMYLTPRRLPKRLELPPLMLALAGLVLGVAPTLYTASIGSLMVRDLLPNSQPHSLKLWHGTDPTSLMAIGISILTIGCAIVAAYRWKDVHVFCEKILNRFSRLDFQHGFDRFLSYLLQFSLIVTRTFQNGSLLRYVQTTMVGTLLIMMIPIFLLVTNHSPQSIAIGKLDWIVLLIVCAPLILALRDNKRLSRIIFLGLSGFGIIVLFSFYSAIDLAITQLAVEALTIIFMLSLLYKLPQLSDQRTFSPVNFTLSILFSLCLLTLLTYRHIPSSMRASQYYIDHAFTHAFGKNIVNVILVDFRSLDTFGEIIVVAIAALGVNVLLCSNKGARSDV